MITCAECIKSLHPDDPRIPSGRYRQNICDYCDKPVYFRNLEAQQPPEQIIVHRHANMSKQEHDLLQQTALKTDYLLKRLKEKPPYIKKYKYF